jgi:hypothetical protein
MLELHINQENISFANLDEGFHPNMKAQNFQNDLINLHNSAHFDTSTFSCAM